MGSHGSVNKPLALRLMIWFLAGLFAVVVPGRALSGTCGCRRVRRSPPIYTILETPREQGHALRVVADVTKDNPNSDTIIGLAFFHVRRQPVHGLLLEIGSETKRSWNVEWSRVPRVWRPAAEDRALVQSMVIADLVSQGRHTEADDIGRAGQLDQDTSLLLILLDISLVTFLGWVATMCGRIFMSMVRHVFTTNRESRRERSIRFQQCPGCGYCIAHLREARCPECGEVPRPGEQWPLSAGASS